MTAFIDKNVLVYAHASGRKSPARLTGRLLWLL